MNYIFLDEIQHCKNFEKAVNFLFIKNNCDVYITGSNAYFMSGELATVLSGRYVEIQMLPLSFKEFNLGLDEQYGNLSLKEKFNLYVNYGSFPFITKYNNFTEMIQRIIYKVFLIQYLIKILQEGLILRIQYRLKMSQNFYFTV